MRNIIITGGGFVNKGAQAMTFISVSELKNRFPDHEIFLYSPTDLLNKEDFSNYNFKVFGWFPKKFAKAQNNKLLYALCNIKNHSEFTEANNIYKNCDLMIDISGYALGSNWKKKICDDYLDCIEFARGYNIPIYLMPQSFGPFKYNDPDGIDTDNRTADLFPYAKKIFVREKEGFEELIKRYNLSNVELANDLVLSSSITKYNVYKNNVNIDIPNILPNSIAVIPNSKTIEFGDIDAIMNLYKQTISTILKNGKNVYLISHSKMDSKYCEKIKSMFIDNDNVIYLDQDLSCVQFNEIVKQLDFVIASRFHSIVHAYKNGTPCIALGWATKYIDLLSLFNQERFMYDVRKKLDFNSVIENVEYLTSHHNEEKEIILSILPEVQKNNVFDVLELKY